MNGVAHAALARLGHRFAEPVFGGWCRNEKIVIGSDEQSGIFMTNDAEIRGGRSDPSLEAVTRIALHVLWRPVFCAWGRLDGVASMIAGRPDMRVMTGAAPDAIPALRAALGVVKGQYFDNPAGRWNIPPLRNHIDRMVVISDLLFFGHTVFRVATRAVLWRRPVAGGYGSGPQPFIHRIMRYVTGAARPGNNGAIAPDIFCLRGGQDKIVIE